MEKFAHITCSAGSVMYSSLTHSLGSVNTSSSITLPLQSESSMSEKLCRQHWQLPEPAEVRSLRPEPAPVQWQDPAQGRWRRPTPSGHWWSSGSAAARRKHSGCTDGSACLGGPGSSAEPNNDWSWTFHTSDYKPANRLTNQRPALWIYWNIHELTLSGVMMSQVTHQLFCMLPESPFCSRAALPRS